MKKFLIFIIGIMAIGLWLNPINAHAQQAGPEDCEKTLYENEFRCQQQKVYSYCSLVGRVDAALEDSFSGDAAKFNFYRNAYCNITRDSNDEIYKILAEQFAVEDPKYDADLIKFILEKVSTESIQAYLEINYGDPDAIDKLPAAYAFGIDNIAEQSRLYLRVKNAYEREKVIHQSKESLKQQFKGRDMWANGSLLDSPFDLIVDLNLIEIALFGSQAKWMDDVYSFGSPDGEAGSGDEEPSSAETTEDEEGIQPDEDEDGELPPEIDQYECVSDEEPEDVEFGEIPLDCGNNKLDAGEGCDDGNNMEGDGCSANCLLENLSCQDPEAITFTQFSLAGTLASGMEGGSADENEIPITCPPGTTAVKKPLEELPQSPNYPGPFVGGVLKNFPPSERPPCPAGWSPFEIKVGGKTEGPEATRCIPAEFCASFEDARQFLFGEDYENDPVVSELAESIEAIICIEVKTVMRPESPYPLQEGCIDCHILGMVDVMEKMLEKNVAPLQNNMQAWGLSNRWGPSFTFDIVTSVKSLLKISPPKKDKTELELAKLQTQQLLQDSTDQFDPAKDQPKATAITDSSAIDIIGGNVGRDIKDEEEFYRGLKNYRSVGEAEVSGRNTANDILPLLEQMRKSFERLQNRYVSLATTVTFNEKRQCTFD